MGVDVDSIIPISDGVPPPALVEPAAALELDGQTHEAFGSAILNALLALAGAAPTADADLSAAALLPDLAGQPGATEESTPDETDKTQEPPADDATKPVASALIRLGPLEWVLSTDVASAATSGTAATAAGSPTAPDGRVVSDGRLPDDHAPTGQPGRIPVPEGTPEASKAEPRVLGADGDVVEALAADGIRSRSVPADAAVASEHPDVSAVDADQPPAPTPNTPGELRAVRSALIAASSPPDATGAKEVQTPESATSRRAGEPARDSSAGADAVERRALGSLVARLGTSPSGQWGGADAAVAGPPEPVASRDVSAPVEASPTGGSADGPEDGPSEREADGRADTAPARRAVPSHVVAARLAPYLDAQSLRSPYGAGDHGVSVESVAQAAPVQPVRTPTEVSVRAEIPAAGAVLDLGGDAAAASSGPDSVVRAVRLMWRDGLGEARLQLQPERLGTVLVSLRIEDGVVSASVRAETPAALQWLQAHQHDLRAALNSQGLDFDRFLSADEHPSEGRGQERDRQRDPESRRQRSSDDAHSSGRRFEVLV